MNKMGEEQEINHDRDIQHNKRVYFTGKLKELLMSRRPPMITPTVIREFINFYNVFVLDETVSILVYPQWLNYDFLHLIDSLSVQAKLETNWERKRYYKFALQLISSKGDNTEIIDAGYIPNYDIHTVSLSKKLREYRKGRSSGHRIHPHGNKKISPYINRNRNSSWKNHFTNHCRLFL